MDQQKLEDAVLALLGAFQSDQGRAWKRYAFSVMEALHAQGWNTDPRGRAESVCLTPEGQARARQLARQLFGA